MAETDAEHAALDERYRAALAAAERRGCAERVEAFERAVSSSRAVIARSLLETMRLAEPDSLYATFHQLMDAGARLPDGTKWSILRTVTDLALFGSAAKAIRFAALALTDRGVDRYGECTWVLDVTKIEDRTSVFEENSVMFMDRHQIRLTAAHDLPKGYRASWRDRGRLCVAKLAAAIEPDTADDAFPALLLEQGESAERDAFVEVHVYGNVHVETLARIVVRPKTAAMRTLARALRAKLAAGKPQVGVEIESWTR